MHPLGRRRQTKLLKENDLQFEVCICSMLNVEYNGRSAFSWPRTLIVFSMRPLTNLQRFVSFTLDFIPDLPAIIAKFTHVRDLCLGCVTPSPGSDFLACMEPETGALWILRTIASLQKPIWPQCQEIYRGRMRWRGMLWTLNSGTFGLFVLLQSR